MKIVNFNESNLTEKEINEIVVRVKVFLFNSNNEILIATSNGGCQLPGGHIEDKENLIAGIIREVQEETGIELVPSEIEKPFYEINHYTKNYKNTGRNRISRVRYYVVNTNKEPNLNNINLTESEKANNFSVSYVHKDNLVKYVNNFLNETQIEINKVIAKEILLAYEHLDK